MVYIKEINLYGERFYSNSLNNSMETLSAMQDIMRFLEITTQHLNKKIEDHDMYF